MFQLSNNLVFGNFYISLLIYHRTIRTSTNIAGYNDFHDFGRGRVALIQDVHVEFMGREN